jgi:hypothetical protein
VGKDRRREAIRVDTVEKVTPKQIQTNKAKFNAESGLQIGRFAPEYLLCQKVKGRSLAVE